MKSDWIFSEGIDETVALDHAGFVYLITDTLTGRAYVGKKSFWSKAGGKLGPSDWRNYFGSCKPLKADLKAFGKERFRREVLSVHRTSAAMNYEEVAEQFRRDVLNATLPDGSRAYYNGNILSRWFVAPPHKPETKIKIGAAIKGRKRPDLAARNALRAGTPHKPETIEKIRALKIARDNAAKNAPEII